MYLQSLLATGTRTPRRILAAELFAFSSQKRAASRARMAPNLRYKDRRKQPIVWTHQEKVAMDTARQERDEFIAEAEKRNRKVTPLTADERALYAETTKEAAMLMTDNQARFLLSWRVNTKSNNGDAAAEFKTTIKLMKDIHHMSLDDVYDLTFILRNKGGAGCARTGRDLVTLCSESGHAEATIQVVASCLRQDATKPGVLRTRTAMLALERLRNISKAGNVRAIVMEANVARHNGLVEQATALYNRALKIIMDPNPSTTQDKYSELEDELSSPWIELAYLHVTRGENVKAMKAYMCGLEKDDPMAYFNLARLDFHMAGNQHTHDWLYNMTKAAASGHYKAAHELGEYYANSPAEPPQPPKSFMEKLHGFAHYFISPNINLDPKTNIHHHDAFGKTPEMRIDLACQWLKLASLNHYLPANITLAQLYLQKFIYPKGTLLKPLDPFGHSTEPDEIPNHLFSPDLAQAALTQVLTACLQISEAKSVSKTNAEYLLRAKPWSEHKEVLEVIESTESLQELKEQAEMIADAAGLDIKSTNLLPKGVPHLGFIRFHKGIRGQGLWEADEKEWLVAEDEQQVEKRV